VWSEKLPFAEYSVVKELKAFGYQLTAFTQTVLALADSRKLLAKS
jgi:hypothetical protein